MANKPWTGHEIDRAKRLYERGYSSHEVGEVLGRGAHAVLRTLRAHGVKVRNVGPARYSDERECISFAAMCEDAIVGSSQLLYAIQRAGLRP